MMSHSLSSWLQNIKNDDIDGGLAADFDGSLSGLGVELGSSTYNMSEALLALPVFKQESLETGFQYILSAATSPATKMNEETLTYLNQGQSYEIKLKKFGDLTELRGRLLRTVIRVVFHERRMQYMEKEQLQTWRQQRPGERIVDIDIPLSYALTDIKVDPNLLNAIEFKWDPNKDTGAYVKVHCISTEFTAKKHGGEKGIPFRVQVETYLDEDEEAPRLLHCASCQIKVFKPKGADRKHKTDREKMDKRSDAEKEKYQPSYECTVLTEISLEQVQSYLQQQLSQDFDQKDRQLTNSAQQPVSIPSSPPIQMPQPEPPSPIHVSPQPSPSPSLSSQQQALRNFQCLAESYNSNSSCESSTVASAEMRTTGKTKRGNSVPRNSKPKHRNSRSSINSLDGQLPPPEELPEVQLTPLPATAGSSEVTQWLISNRFSSYTKVFQNFSGADLLRLTRDDLIQICGIADGIRLNNALQSKNVRPRLTLYVCQGSSSIPSSSMPASLSSSPASASVPSSFAMPAPVGSQEHLPHPSSSPASSASIASFTSPPHVPGVTARATSPAAPRGWSCPDYQPHFHSVGSLPNINEFVPFDSHMNFSHNHHINQTAEMQFEELFDHNHNRMAPSRKYARPMVRRHSLPQQFPDSSPPLSFTLGGDETQEGALMRVWEELMGGGTGSLSSLMQHWPARASRKVLEAPSVVAPGNSSSSATASPTSSSTSRSPTTPTCTASFKVRSHSVPSVSTVAPPPASAVPVPNTVQLGIHPPEEADHPSVILHTYSTPVPMPTAAPTKRQLTEDLDNSDCEIIMTSSKKQRTRNLEMSRKEVYHALYLESLTVQELMDKIANLFSINGHQFLEANMQGPLGISVLVTDSVIQNMRDQSRFAVEATQDDHIPDRFKLLMTALD